jgi:hypothetical protein
MFFRLMVLIALAVVLLPTDERRQSEVYSTARYALERTITFCDRNAALCESGREMWAVFVRKAEFGLELVTKLARGASDTPRPDVATDPAPAFTAPALSPAAPNFSPPKTSTATAVGVPVAPLAPAAPQASVAQHPQARPTPTGPPRSTLSQADTQPQWRAPGSPRSGL